jgi:hypothetical protein
MYKLVYKEMIAAEIAEELDNNVFFDKHNNIVPDDDDSKFGTTSNIRMTDESYLIFVDETGSSTNMRKDKTFGKKVIAECGCLGTKGAISSDLRYTTMGFTAGNGQPVMCCVIMTSDSNKGIPNSWFTGIDITKIDKNFELTDDNNEMINTLKCAGGVAGGGPRCSFRNKEVPCFVQYSPHGGITPTILTNCLKQMDALNLFPREFGKKPFLLLDGHDSRFDLQFLRYIRDADHPWCVCIGLPYGTHLWQVGDSPAQNGNFKNYEQQFKDILLKEKRIRRMGMVLKPTDVIPIVNYAWERSFNVVRNNKKAILQRGWFPLNRALLLQPEVLQTRCIDIDDQNRQPTVQNNDDGEKITIKINGNHGITGILFHDVIDEHKNHPETMKKNRERKMLADLTKEVEAATRKLTSGAAFYNDIVALHSDTVWDNQKKWHDEKQLKEQEKKTTAKRLFFAKKEKSDEIRKRPRASWSIDNIQTLLTYKRQKNDPTIKKSKTNRQIMLDEYDRCMYRPTPPCSPIDDDDRSTNPTSPIHVTDVDAHVEIEEL